MGGKMDMCVWRGGGGHGGHANERIMEKGGREICLVCALSVSCNKWQGVAGLAKCEGVGVGRGNPREMWENGEMRTMGTEPKSRRTMTICGRWQLPKKHKKTEIVFHCAYVHRQKICVIYQKLKNLHYVMRKKTQSRSLAFYASVDASFFDYFIFFFSVLYYTFCTVSANIFECVLVCRNWIRIP